MLRNAKLTSIHGGFPFPQYPERFAQEALGQNSKAVHRAYSLKAKGRLPSLASYEKQIGGGPRHSVPTGTGSRAAAGTASAAERLTL